jgi:hypothetical protein
MQISRKLANKESLKCALCTFLDKPIREKRKHPLVQHNGYLVALCYYTKFKEKP